MFDDGGGYLYFIGDGVNAKLGLEVAKGIYPLQSIRFACEKNCLPLEHKLINNFKKFFYKKIKK